MGMGDLRQINSHPNVEIVALCDVDANRLASAAKSFPHARRYQDWRELLEKEGDKIDSVNVSTPDHAHASITLSAINRGKNVYCQKPLTHDVFEARKIAEAAAKAEAVTQMGIQVNATVGYRRAVKMIRDGAIGKVKQIYAWSNKPAGNYRPTGPRPKGVDPVPANLDWDAWLGTAPDTTLRTEPVSPSGMSCPSMPTRMCFWRLTSPLSSIVSPLITFISVDFPAPLRPSRQRRSPTLI